MLVGLIIFFYGLHSYGQDVLPQFIPPSPDVYSLAKYGDIPVGYYSGTPEINIPIWTITDGDISVPVSLSYHAGGIKVDEIASWVGLGWSLNAGGVITRVIMEDPDRPDSTGTSLYCDRMDETFQWFDDYVVSYGSSVESLNNYYGDIESYYGASNIDNEPDVFYYNFNGRYGKFIFDNNGIARPYKHDNIQITWKGDGTDPDDNIFIIKDETGNTYEFNSKEYTYYGGNSQISAWYLSEIISPAGDSITFSYQEYWEWNNYRHPSDQFLPIVTGYAPQWTSINNYDPDLQRELKLTKISTSRGDSVNFIPDLQNRRLDYLDDNPTYPLKEIVVNSRGDKPERIFAINTSYFVAEDTNTVNLELNRRLRLDGVTEYTGDRTSSKEICGFDYFGDDTSESGLRLPYRLSPSQDHWGYFNGADNDGMLPGKEQGIIIDGSDNIVYQFIADILNYNTGGYYSGSIIGADREPEASRKEACTLKRINYPTGGNVEFDYESHTSEGNNVAGIRISQITKNSGSSPPIIVDYSYSGDCLPVTFSVADYFSYFNVPEELPVFTFRSVLMYVLAHFFNFPSIYVYQGEIDIDGTIFEYEAAYQGNYIRVLANPPAVLNGVGGSVGYEHVTETIQGNGRTVYTYSSPDSYGDEEVIYGGYDNFRMQYLETLLNGTVPIETTSGSTIPKAWPYLPVYSLEWERGLLMCKTIYSEGSSMPDYSEGYIYETENLGNIPGYQVLEHLMRVWTGNGFLDPVDQYLVLKYYTSYNWVAPSEKQVSYYSPDGVIEETTDYVYNDDVYRFLNKTVTTNSAGDTIEIRYRYPSDLNDTSIYGSMEAANMLNYPIEQTKVVNNNVTESRLVTYRQDSSRYLPDKVYSLEITEPVQEQSFDFFDGFEKDSRYGTISELSYDSYDDRGNITQISKIDGTKESIIWGYNNSYPVVKLEGLEYSEINSTIKEYFSNRVYSSGSNYNDVAKDIDSLKIQLSPIIQDPYNKVYIYTYKPFVGMTSQTDPNGVTIYYGYDSFGRLETVRDNDWNILEGYEYHYGEQ